MAILHAATLSPTKAEVLAAWVPAQPWAQAVGGGKTADAAMDTAAGVAMDIVGAFRFDDPEGQVGLEVHLVQVHGVLFQVPLTYRDAALADAEGHLVATVQHSVLGERWVYDGLGDPVFVRMMAAVALTGCGQAVGMVEYQGRWLVVPTPVRLVGGGWSDKRVPVDGFERVADDGDWAVLKSDRLEMRVARRPGPGERPAIGLTATWPGQDEPVILAEVRSRQSG